MPFYKNIVEFFHLAVLVRIGIKYLFLANLRSSHNDSLNEDLVIFVNGTVEISIAQQVLLGTNRKGKRQNQRDKQKQGQKRSFHFPYPFAI